VRLLRRQLKLIALNLDIIKEGKESVMLCFVIALKSKAVSKDWEKVSYLFETTVRSAYQQSDPNFKIVVVCHETPNLKGTYDQRLEIINVDFPPPSQAKMGMQDKWKKLAIGMVRVGTLNPDFVMIMDADDWVNYKLSAYVHAHAHENGWIMKRGYRYRFGRRWLYLDERFNCGTNAIINSKLIQFPTEPDQFSQCILLTSGHTVIEKDLAKLGKPLSPLPFCGVIHVVEHGDNDMALHAKTPDNPGFWQNLRFKLGVLRRTRPLTQKIKQEFGLTSL
jgi:hypothetical protein